MYRSIMSAVNVTPHWHYWSREGGCELIERHSLNCRFMNDTWCYRKCGLKKKTTPQFSCIRRTRLKQTRLDERVQHMLIWFSYQSVKPTILRDKPARLLPTTQRQFCFWVWESVPSRLPPAGIARHSEKKTITFQQKHPVSFLDRLNTRTISLWSTYVPTSCDGRSYQRRLATIEQGK